MSGFFKKYSNQWINWMIYLDVYYELFVHYEWDVYYELDIYCDLDVTVQYIQTFMFTICRS